VPLQNSAIEINIENYGAKTVAEKWNKDENTNGPNDFPWNYRKRKSKEKTKRNQGQCGRRLL